VLSAVFVASTQRSFDAGVFGATYVIDTDLFASVVTRRGLIFDTRFAPPRTGSSDDLLLYLVVDGQFAQLSSPAQIWAGPTLVVLDEDQFEGALGRPGLPLRSWGDPFRVVELRVARRSVCLDPLPPRPFVWPLERDAWERARGCLAASEAGAPIEPPLRALLEELARVSVVRRELVDGLSVEDQRFTRLWTAARPMAEEFDLVASLDAIALGAGLSLRHVTREVKDFASALRVPFWGWRESTRCLRMKVAMLGLSVETMPIAEVARIAGYGSVEATGRAFRDASLEAPSRVRQRLLESPFGSAVG
jgi:AraC-like DNA-binding protein